jgi:Sulfotransferase family
VTRPSKTKPDKRPPVLIIGAHRSGTTATARALQTLGLQIGGELDSHEEPRELRKLHDTYLQSEKASWHEPEAFLNSLKTPEEREKCHEYLREKTAGQLSRLLGYRRKLFVRPRFGVLDRQKPWGWKEPRTTLFAGSWLQLYPEARILHIVRHPLAVAMSIQRRELDFQAKGDAPTGRVHDLSHCLKLAVIYMEAGRAIASQTDYYKRVRFEDIQTEPAGTLTSLAEFCGLTPSESQLAEASTTIRADKSKMWRNIPNSRELLAKYPITATFGYHS